MRRIFPAYTYSDGPRNGCWWDQTCDLPLRPAAEGTISADVAVIGAGFTGLSAALHLAEQGVRVVVLDAGHIGWGASGRNGGFCCLGGSKAGDEQLDRRFGKAGRLEWRKAEKAAVELVGDLLDRFGIAADRHSKGETLLALRRRDLDVFEQDAASVAENYGVTAHLTDKASLPGEGFGGPFHGALTVPVGFGLNPRKYLVALAAAAEKAGAFVYEGSQVEKLSDLGTRYSVETSSAAVHADQVIVATNGYSSEDLPGWLGGRYMPTQSTVLVTRPLSEQELSDQGWTSDQMSYDSRNLLHYFRLMPDRRFLFGMRGGLMSGARAEVRARHAVRRHFEWMFPGWRHVESCATWSGMVCIARDRMPFVGAVPGERAVFAGLGFHGNGVAMGTLTGRMLADLTTGRSPEIWPRAVQDPLRPFPLGSLRRLLMPPLYAALWLSDL